MQSGRARRGEGLCPLGRPAEPEKLFYSPVPPRKRALGDSMGSDESSVSDFTGASAAACVPAPTASKRQKTADMAMMRVDWCDDARADMITMKICRFLSRLAPDPRPPSYFPGVLPRVATGIGGDDVRLLHTYVNAPIYYEKNHGSWATGDVREVIARVTDAMSRDFGSRASCLCARDYFF